MNAHAQPSPCELSLDADEILTALDEGIDGLDARTALGHLAHCEPCRRAVDLRQKARSAWTATKKMPAPVAMDHTELRRVWEGRSAPQPRRQLPSRAVIAFAAATPFAIAAVAIALILRPSPQAMERHEASSAPALVAPPRSAAASGVNAPPAILPPSSSPANVARSMTVPAGSHVMLGFAISVGTLDPEGSAELVGPASATATDTSLTVQHGTVRMRGLRNVTVVVPGARVDPNGSTCTVTVDDRGVARLDVETGRATILGRGGGVVTVESGGTMQLDPDGLLRVSQPVPQAKPPSGDDSVRRAAVSATVPAPPAQVVGGTMRAAQAAPVVSSPPGHLAGTPDEALAAARSRMRNGETTAARADLERLASSTDARVARRASFTLAEMDLAAGDREQARVRLDALVVCPEPALGADAATLLARTLPAAERTAVWKRYLATNPPRPYFERALLDRAEALFDSGHGAEARAILDEVRQSPSLTESQRRQLDRLLFKARELR